MNTTSIARRALRGQAATSRIDVNRVDLLSGVLSGIASDNFNAGEMTQAVSSPRCERPIQLDSRDMTGWSYNVCDNRSV
jgi:hypothetical protein